MSRDLKVQRERAQELADALADFIEVDKDGDATIGADGLLDALGCCGLTLQEGNDAGMAWLDGVIADAKKAK